MRGEGASTSYNNVYREAAPQRGTFFTLEVYERVGNASRSI